MREQLGRGHFEPHHLVLSDRIKAVADVADIPGALARVEPEDIYLEGYRSHAAIKASMAA